MTTSDPICSSQIDHSEVLVVDNREARRAEVIVLAAVHEPSRQTGGDPASLNVEPGTDSRAGDIQNDLSGARRQLLAPLQIVRTIREERDVRSGPAPHVELEATNPRIETVDDRDHDRIGRRRTTDHDIRDE